MCIRDRLNGDRIIKISSVNVFLPVLNNNRTTLSSVNLFKGYNDTQLNNIISYYENVVHFNPYEFAK